MSQLKHGATLRQRVLVESGGSPVTSLVSGDFSVSARLAGAAESLTITATEIGTGWYELAVTLPELASGTNREWFSAVFSAGANDVSHGVIQAQLVRYDGVDARAAAVRQVTTLTSGQVGDPVNLTLRKDRYASLSFTVSDDDGVALALDTDWSNYAVTISAADGTTLDTIADGDISRDDSGGISFAIPEDAAMFDELMDPTQPVVVHYEVRADLGGNAARTQTIFAGTIRILRSEG